VIEKAGSRRIVDLYSEREPCKKKCQKLVKDMNVSHTVRWNGVDREAATKELNGYIKQFFDSP
jgi:hypothetical protein